MKDQKQDQLRKELRDAGATSRDIDELVPIASRLRLLRSDAAAKAPTMRHDRFRRILRPSLIGITGLAAGMLLVIISQSVSPTNVLYPLQEFSDNVAISLHPDYRATVMMKRAMQVNELVADHADQGKVIATLADYTHEASAYKSTPDADYAAFEYCKANLQQAASAASPAVHRAIVSSLQSLQSV